MPETIGQRLRKAREYRSLTLEKAEEATRIRLQFLQALEADDFSAMPSPVQARGFLRNYAEYLGLDLDQIVEELKAVRPEPEVEPEIIFEGEIDTPSQEPKGTETEGGEETTSEPFWQTWLKRVRQEAGQFNEEPVSEQEPVTVSSPEGAPAIETESSSETEADQREEEAGNETGFVERPNRLTSFLRRFNIRISRGQADISAPVMETESEPELEPELKAPAPQEPSSQEIIKKIGLQLRQRREMLSLTLDEIERHTHMRAQFLRALEGGNFEEMPSPVQTRGMLTNYADFLDLDSDDLLLQFAEALQVRHRERHPEKPARRRGQPNIPTSVPTLRSFIAGDLVFGVGMIFLLVVFSIWGISRVIVMQTEQQAEAEVEAEATGPSISEALIGTPIETVEAEVTLIPAEDTPIAELPEGTVEIPTLAIDVNVQVNIVAVERTFLRVVVDGEEVFNGRTIPGNAYSYEAEQNIEILVGNGAAVRVIYNQRNLGLLGGFGQIASFIYTADEVIVPTPEIPPTATNTPYLSPTPSSTPSPTPTPTVLPEGETGQ